MLQLNTNMPMSKVAQDFNLDSWSELVGYVEKLPYGRNSDRSDFSLVLKEGKGTCSSKHAFLRLVAKENNLHQVEQILGIYKMNEINTPGVGQIQLTPEVNYIPEAHSYLRINGVYYDYTSPTASYQRIKDDILREIIIEPEDVVEKKFLIHKKFILEWIDELGVGLTFSEVWSARENCIINLSKINQSG